MSLQAPGTIDTAKLPLNRASDESVSIFLDLIRFLTAAFVVLAHFSWGIFSGLPALTGHSAVIVFFILSGYVIAMTTEHKDKTLRQYAVARLSRLYSVVIPALALTLIADTIGMSVKPDLYYPGTHDHILVPLLTAATYTNQLWFFNGFPLSNSPYWSLPYEFWFYVLWGIFFYMEGRRRAVLTVIVLLIIGPKIIMYLPLWLLGVALYRMRHKTVGASDAYTGILLGLVLLPLLYWVSLQTRFDMQHLADGSWVSVDNVYVPDAFSFCDYAVGAVVAGIILLFPSTGANLSMLKKPVRFFAMRSFSLYLYHLPLLYLFTALTFEKIPQPQREIAVIVLTVSSILFLATCTELRKGVWTRFFDRVLPGRAP